MLPKFPAGESEGESFTRLCACGLELLSIGWARTSLAEDEAAYSLIRSLLLLQHTR